jgi:hypothetical protein
MTILTIVNWFNVKPVQCIADRPMASESGWKSSRSPLRGDPGQQGQEHEGDGDGVRQSYGGGAFAWSKPRETTPRQPVLNCRSTW